jgi:hypothetical protein
VIFKVNPSPFWMINLITADEAIFPEISGEKGCAYFFIYGKAS